MPSDDELMRLWLLGEPFEGVAPPVSFGTGSVVGLVTGSVVGIAGSITATIPTGTIVGADIQPGGTVSITTGTIVGIGGSILASATLATGSIVGVASIATGTTVVVRGGHDPVSEIPVVVIDYAHHEIHEGEGRVLRNYIDLTNGQIYNIGFISTTGSYMHLILAFGAEAESHVELWEGATFSASGSPVTPVNRNRFQADEADAKWFAGVTVAVSGTFLAAWKMGSGKNSSGEALERAEWILKKGTPYFIRLVNDTSSNNWLLYDIDYYIEFALGST